MPRLKVAKQILYDFRSEENPERHNFVIIVIDNKIEGNKVEQIIKEKLQPTEGVTSSTRRITRTSNLCRTIEFISYRQRIQDINWQSIYEGKSSRDVNVCERKRKNILENYIDSMASSGKLV